MSRASRLWAQAVAASRSPSPPIKRKKPEKPEPPVRVEFPTELKGSTLVVMLDSLKSQIKTEHMERPCRLYMTDTEIRVEWGESECLNQRRISVQNAADGSRPIPSVMLTNA